MKKYTFFYESQGYNFLLEEIIMTSYAKWPLTVVNVGNHARKYVPIDVPVQLNQKGLTFTEADIETSLRVIQENVQELKGLPFDTAMSPDTFSIIVNKMETILSSYSIFDTSYSEGIYLQNPDDSRGVLIEKTKNVIRDDFDWLFFREDGLLETVLKTIAIQTNQDIESVRWHKANELLSLIEKATPLPEEEIASRKSMYLLERDDEGVIGFVSGNEAQSKIDAFLKELETSSIATLKGTVAHGKGRMVTGSVYIIHRDYSNYKKLIDDMSAMPEGSILVTTITDPEFLPAMQKASAIVTDIGGLLSHAAISARELNKLCIVGTSDASKVFKTGDVVEVNGETGIIKKA